MIEADECCCVDCLVEDIARLRRESAARLSRLIPPNCALALELLAALKAEAQEST